MCVCVGGGVNNVLLQSFFCHQCVSQTAVWTDRHTFFRGSVLVFLYSHLKFFREGGSDPLSQLPFGSTRELSSRGCFTVSIIIHSFQGKHCIRQFLAHPCFCDWPILLKRTKCMVIIVKNNEKKIFKCLLLLSFWPKFKIIIIKCKALYQKCLNETAPEKQLAVRANDCPLETIFKWHLFLIC